MQLDERKEDTNYVLPVFYVSGSIVQEKDASHAGGGISDDAKG